MRFQEKTNRIIRKALYDGRIKVDSLYPKFILPLYNYMVETHDLWESFGSESEIINNLLRDIEKRIDKGLLMEFD